jgi:hypothetical protein
MSRFPTLFVALTQESGIFATVKTRNLKRRSFR